MYRALIHHWRINLAVLVGGAVATAVLGGALLVGDSVRGSLRALTLDRLGNVDSALVTERFFRESLADELARRIEATGSYVGVAPAVVLQGAAVQADSRQRASRVGIHGIDLRFTSVFGAPEQSFSRAEGQLFPSVVINESLSRELEAAAGDTLLLSFGLHGSVPRDTLMGDRDAEDVLGTMRVDVIRVVPDRGLGRFGVRAAQQTPLNAFVEIGALQRALDQRGRVNALFLSDRSADVDANRVLGHVLTLDDLGLNVEIAEDHLVVESHRFVLRPDVDEAVGEAAFTLGAPLLRVQSYLANAMRFGERVLPYSAVAAVDAFPGADWSSLLLLDGSPAPPVEDDGVLLNRWAADDLGASVGDEISIEYFVVGPREELSVEQRSFRVQGIVAMTALAGDPTLTPDYPGLQDADDMSEWDPPFPIDLDRIRPRDEEYWDLYRATPKAFVRLETGRRLWGTRFGSTTSVRVGPAAGGGLDRTRARIEKDLMQRLSLESFGFRFRSVKQEGVRAAAGATDFSGLFVAFSFFLIVSAALLVGLLFGLGVERRAGEVGLLLALGYPLRRVRAGFLREGALLAAVGASAGLAGSVGYAWLMMAALRTLWLPAVGSSQLFLHVEPGSLAVGWFGSVLVILLSIGISLRRLNRVPPPALLAGSLREAPDRRTGKSARRLAWGGLVLAAGLAAYAIATGATSSAVLAFGAGAALLVSGLAFFAVWCREARRRGAVLRTALLGMAARNSAWRPGRSILSVALVASASFVIVLVAANRQEPGDELDAKGAGTGGFALLAETDVPLHQDLSRPDARADLGFSRDDSKRLADVGVVPFRVQPGDEASCLNLYRPETPRVLGVPDELITRGGFDFQKTVPLPDGEENPWELLTRPIEPGVIPAFGDANSVMWILHLGLGKDVEMTDELGQPLRLRLVGLLRTSIFQSEILIAESAFLEHFPGRTGYGYFLIDAPREEAPELTRVLETRLAGFGFDATTTREKIAGYKTVEHTYLSTFQTLGGLGLLLGTVGLGVVLVRNVIERRGELATMRAFGFRRASLGRLVLAENAFLLLLGVAIGSLAAFVAVAPRLASLHVPWSSLALTLAAVLVVGMLASAVAVFGALRVPLLPALKTER